MANYLNGIKAYTLYKTECQSQYFIDKSKILTEIIPLLTQSTKHICITRPRRFGKTVMVGMLASFFSKGFDSSSIFDKLEISKYDLYRKHLNKHNVIYIDFSNLPDECENYKDYISNIKELIKEDLIEAYPDCNFREKASIWEVLNKIHSKTRDQFIFILDEWDSLFHNSLFTENDHKEYLTFLKNLLKTQPYVEFAYMTGVLPIAKYSSGSELNMFVEYNMATSERFSEYFGFTEKEVQKLYKKYESMTIEPKILYHQLQDWYNGYYTATGERVYNPRSIVLSFSDNQIRSYWTSSGPYDEIFYYISHNIYDVREDIVRMVAGECIKAEVHDYAAISMKLNTREEILSAMVVYGFLSYYKGMVSIPNKELMQKFESVVKKEEMGYVAKLALESERMLKATKSGDTKTMIEILSFAHDTEVPILNYNNEADLAALVNLIYLAARDEYRIEREDRAGKGYVDFIFYPFDKYSDGIILELKVDQKPEHAIEQIKEKNYPMKFKGKLGEEKTYKGRIIVVGIVYEKNSKEHRCLVEVLK